MTMGLTRKALILAITLGVGLLGCSNEKDPSQAKKTAPPAAVEVALVQPRDLVEAVEVVGTLTPRYEARIRAEYSGIVSDIYVNEWVRVKKGTPLALLDTREIEVLVQKAQAAVEAARANVLQAEVGSARAERELNRAQQLKEAGLITQQMLDEVKTEKAASAARLAAARAQLLAAEKDLQHGRTRLAKAVIRSPMDGVVALKNVNVGDLVGEPGSQRILFQIVDSRLLELTVTVPSVEMARLKIGQPLTFTVDAFPERIFSGKVKYINPTVSDADRSVKVLVEVPNPQEVLKPGLFVKGRILTAERKGVLLIPREALVFWDVNAKQGEVYVVEAGRVKKKTVQTGAVSADGVETVSGLQPGESVITRGGFTVKEGDPVRVVPGNGGK